jgi:hypothetical protein
MMSRSMYQFTPEILEFKNKEGKLMVLYDVGQSSQISLGADAPHSRRPSHVCLVVMRPHGRVAHPFACVRVEEGI